MKSTKHHLFKALLLSGVIVAGLSTQSKAQSQPDPQQAAVGQIPQDQDTTKPGDRSHHFRRPGGPGQGQGFQPGIGGRGFRPGREGGRTGNGWAHHRGPGVRYTPEQRKQLMAINKEFKQKESDLFAKDNITLKEYKANLIALHKEKKARLDGLLTPDQKDQIARRKKATAENMQVMEAARMERLKIHLNLSDDQIGKLKAGQANLHQQAQAIHENDNILPQQKRQQMKDLMAKRNDIYKSVLTPEQYSKFEQMSQHRHDFNRGGGFPGGGGPGRGFRPGSSGDRGDRPQAI